MLNLQIYKRKQDIAKAYKYSIPAIDKHLANGDIIRIGVEGVGKTTFYVVATEWIEAAWELQKNIVQSWLDKKNKRKL